MLKYEISRPYRLSVAPMMDWTDRHCRFFHRQFTRRTTLYTEMVTTAAVLHGDRDMLLAHDLREHPIVLQLGGSEPKALAQCAALAHDAGFDEINLNVGCPSDRVQSGWFGAVLMRSPDLVADCVKALVSGAAGTPVSVKCRIGVDEQDPETALPRFLETLQRAGLTRVTIHARKAWLKGLSPKENREIPPLDHDLVHRMKRAFPDMTIVLNGGVATLDQARDLIAQGLDGVMIGRAAYHDPGLLGAADRIIFGDDGPDVTAEQAVVAMLPYIERELGAGAQLHQITRHMLGAFHGRPGARAWRRMISEEAHKRHAGPELVLRALGCLQEAA